MRAKDFGAAAKAVLAVADKKYSDIFPIGIEVSDQEVRVVLTQPMQQMVLVLDVVKSAGDGMLLITRDALAEFVASCAKQPNYAVANVRGNGETVTCSISEEGTLLAGDPNHTTRESPSVKDEAVSALEEVANEIHNTFQSCELSSVVLTPAAARAIAQAAQSLGEVIEVHPHRERGRAFVKVGEHLTIGLDAWGKERAEAAEHRMEVGEEASALSDLPGKVTVNVTPLRGL